VYEVSPRDGLQNESNILPLAAKRELILCLDAGGAGPHRSHELRVPRWVHSWPTRGLGAVAAPSPRVTFSALCPNATGLERAKLAGLKEVAIFLSASESHNQRNTNKSIQRSLEVSRS
jgi:hydroxymethylglutaryl-CoA lyase